MKFEQLLSPETENKEQEKGILDANNFDELFEILDKIGIIEGSKRLFSPEKLKGIITEVREGKADLEAVTRTAGLRDKVAELLGKKGLID